MWTKFLDLTDSQQEIPDGMSKLPFILIHSPLLGTLTWRSVAQDLREQGYDAFTPQLRDSSQIDLPLWQQEVNSIEVPITDAVLVGHSGAGALLPSLGKKLGVQGYIFVDAVLVFNPATRLALMRSEDIEFAQEFEQFLQAGGKFPNWKDEDLKTLIPDDKLRQELLADMHPRSLSFFTEQIEVPASWNTKPCAYIQLSPSYDSYSSQAESIDWTVVRRNTHHFEMVTQPEAIANLLVSVGQKLIE
jgi:hypothetical protein